MAEATFTLRAVDATKQAFASVQNNLSRIDKTARSIASGMKGLLGITVIAGTIRSINSALEDVEANAEKFGLTVEELDRLTIATDAADRAAMAIKSSLAAVATAAVGAFTPAGAAAEAAAIRIKRNSEALKPLNEQLAELNRNYFEIGQSEQVIARETEARISQIIKEAELIRATDPVGATQKEIQAAQLIVENKKRLFAIDEKSFDLQKQLAEATNALGDAQNRLYDGSGGIREILSGKKNEMMQLTIDQQAEENQGIEHQIRLKNELAAVTEEVAQIQEQLSLPAIQAGEMIASGFEDAILSGEKLSNVLKQLGLDLVRLVFQNVVTAPLASGVGNFISKALFRADGGPVSSGSPYIVGERGPELFVPGSSGSIVPNDAMRSGGGGGTSVNITYNIAAGVTKSELGPILESERRRLKAEIPDMVRRGGAYRAAFA
jgi:hypothetical protein